MAMRISRPLIAVSVLVALAAAPALTAGELLPPPEKDARGLYQQSWFVQTDGDLRTDLAAAAAEGKVLALMWEQRGCTYCRQMHEVNLRIPEIVEFMRARFAVVQLDLWGERELVGLDGERRDETATARHNRVNATPVIQFIDAAGTEVFRMPGYADPGLFMAVLEYVGGRGYLTASFREWVRARIAREQAGKVKVRSQ